METLFPAAIFVVGILVMFRGITVRKSGKYLIWIALIFVFGPVLYGIIRIKSLKFLSGNHPWWAYIIAFFIVLIILRVLLNFIFPWRRR